MATDGDNHHHIFEFLYAQEYQLSLNCTPSTKNIQRGESIFCLNYCQRRGRRKLHVDAREKKTAVIDN